ncbi:Txe/YoeB family addiction module toxin [Streptomyces sp. NBC_01306]|uniref:Txe/YoeB family addiction module toxin n=1 Tax=Streptomyces sp. NBC_01306 TaxID=2903819 RepID=UPI002250453D|nr:Txe/YoeB family addiction module toxin [Streptomyces sp. NBC_01306]MCX4724337.1 Txe/YoeB family addiction module toxin [Streptomyces sp. NBC_01306]
MRLVFEDQGWEDCTSWLKNDRKMLARINRLIADVKRDPFTGIGKPEPLKYHLPGAWSRRIDDEHRLVCLVTDKEIVIRTAPGGAAAACTASRPAQRPGRSGQA